MTGTSKTEERFYLNALQLLLQRSTIENISVSSSIEIHIYIFEGTYRNGNATTTPTASSVCSALRTESSLNSILVYATRIEDVFEVPSIRCVVAIDTLPRPPPRGKNRSNYFLTSGTYRATRGPILVTLSRSLDISRMFK